MEGDRRERDLPDDVVYSILHGLPLKDVVRTSGVSRRFARMWLDALATSPVLDFTDRDFVSGRGQTPAQAAATVRDCLRLHAQRGTPLEVFRVAMDGTPACLAAFGLDIIEWIMSVVARGAREVAVKLTPPVRQQQEHAAAGGTWLLLALPESLFVAQNSLERLALDGFSLRATPPAGAAAGFTGLRSLSLSHSDITSEGLQSVLSSCPMLEFLSLRRCDFLVSARIIGYRLRGIEVVSCMIVEKLRVTAPRLESFTFHGNNVYLYKTDLGATPLLRDAYLSHTGFADDDILNIFYSKVYSKLISSVSHARTLTICSVGLLTLVQDGMIDEDLNLTNIQEMQLLMASMAYINILSVSSFFKLNSLPLLDRLFIRILFKPTDGESASTAPLTDHFVDEQYFFHCFDKIVLGHLRLIKVVNFWGTMMEMMMLAFLLKSAPVLDQVVLVTAAAEQGGAPGDELLEIIRDRVSTMRKASSDVRFTVCRPSQDRSQNAAHSRIYLQE